MKPELGPQVLSILLENMESSYIALVLCEIGNRKSPLNMIFFEMKNLAKKATLLGIVGNIVLFILKVIVGFVYNSIAIISDVINSCSYFV